MIVSMGYRRPDRTSSLSSTQKSAQAGSSDHSHWRFLFLAVLLSRTVSVLRWSHFPVPDILKGTVSMFGTEVLKTHILVIIVTIIMLIGLNFFIMRTKTGKSIRAVAEDKDTAALMGIDVDRTITITFATGAAMAGVAGLLYALVFTQTHFFMGFFPGFKAFTAAVLGGIGSIPGAALVDCSLGFIESIGPSLFLEGMGIPAPHQLKDVIAFTMLVLVLIFRPQGILGRTSCREESVREYNMSKSQIVSIYASHSNTV